MNLHKCDWCHYLLVALAIPTVLWISIYTITNLYMKLAGPVDMKKKYKAEWALVTGAGTGIGKSIAENLALQGLNVVLVSLPDKWLDETHAQLEVLLVLIIFNSIYQSRIIAVLISQAKVPEG